MVEGSKGTESKRLFHREGVHEQNLLAPALVLTLGPDRVISLCDLNEWNGSAGAGILCRQTGCFSQCFIGQQTDVKVCCEFYWQPVKGTQQWHTAHK